MAAKRRWGQPTPAGDSRASGGRGRGRRLLTAPSSRINQRPVIGVGAVVFNDRNEILLIKRGKPPHYGRWTVPGGALEWGETLEEAAVREVREETGIEIEIESFVELIEAITPGEDSYHFVITDYVARATGGVLKADSDALDAAWVGVDSLSGYTLTEKLQAVIEKARRISRRLT